MNEQKTESEPEMIPLSEEGSYIMSQIAVLAEQNMIMANRIAETNALLIKLMNEEYEVEDNDDDDDEPEMPESNYAPQAPELSDRDTEFIMQDVV